MGLIGLSSGCFTGDESKLEMSDVHVVELSSHKASLIGSIIDQIRRRKIAVASVHCPCPGRGPGVNLASLDAEWSRTTLAIREATEMASYLDASFIVIHAYYCVPGDLPADDIERMAALRTYYAEGGTISDYLSSDIYASARTLAIDNLKKLLPSLMRDFPRQRIVLENLNPRLGYGGVRLDDVVTMAGAFGGDVGICLDIGHLALSEAATGEQMRAAIDAGKDLIWTTHVHQNFGGRYALDRFWHQDKPNSPLLQEFDTHLPLLSRFRLLPQQSIPALSNDNCAFAGRFEGYAAFCSENDPLDEVVRGSVAVSEILAKVPSSANRILEFDSRFAPLGEILDEYHAAEYGSHPCSLW